MSLPTQSTGGTIAAVCSKPPYVPRSQRVENIPCRHPDPDRPAAGLHVGTRATTPGRQRRSAASGGNYSATRATAHHNAHGSSNAASARSDEYARTDGYGDPGADPDDGTGANCDTNATDGYYATHGNTYLRAAHTHADAHLTTGPADGYGNDQHYHNGIARHGVDHPL